MSYKVLAVNTGSTSTKIALYEDEKEILRRKGFYLQSISCLKQGFNIEIEFYRNYYNNNIRKRNLYVKYE